MVNDVAIRLLREGKNIRPEQTIEAALDEGIDLAVAATLLEKESSGGRNVWGHDAVDSRGIYDKGAEVTEGVFRAYRDAVKAGRIRRLGVGPCQCTSAEFQDRADELGGCWDPVANMRSGFRGMQARIVRAGGNVHDAARSYNGREDYADDFVKRLKVWKARLAGVSVTRTAPSEVEWVTPLAARLGQKLVTRFGRGAEEELAQELTQLSGVTLVSWQHEAIPTIISHLDSVDPEPPEDWPDDRFDVVWVFTRSGAGWRFQQVPQLLLEHDSPDPIGSGGTVATAGEHPAGGDPPPVPSARFPADVVHLEPWKVTLPELDNGGHLLEKKQPKLATFSDEFFALNDDKTGIRFRCHHGAPTTPGSDNPRCELREMTSDGSDLAEWATTKGRHTLRVRGQVNRLTHVRPHVVLAQIHNNKQGDQKSRDITVFRLEGSKLFVTDDDDTHAHLVTADLALGVRYELGFDVADGIVSYTFNGARLPFTLKVKDKSCYFKAGNYLQSNPSKAPSEVATEFSEVVIFRLDVEHET
jgi:hypothetical protein